MAFNVQVALVLAGLRVCSAANTDIAILQDHDLQIVNRCCRAGQEGGLCAGVVVAAILIEVVHIQTLQIQGGGAAGGELELGVPAFRLSGRQVAIYHHQRTFKFIAVAIGQGLGCIEQVGALAVSRRSNSGTAVHIDVLGEDHRNLFLLHQDLAADRALQTISQAGGSTGSGGAGDDFLGMTQRRDLLGGLADKCAAISAVHSYLLRAGGGTGSLHQNFFGGGKIGVIAGSGDLHTLGQLGISNGAVLILSCRECGVTTGAAPVGNITGSATAGLDSSNFDILVAQGRTPGSSQNQIAACALDTGNITGFCTAPGNFCFLFNMRREVFPGHSFTAHSAGEGLRSGSQTGGFLSNDPLALMGCNADRAGDRTGRYNLFAISCQRVAVKAAQIKCAPIGESAGTGAALTLHLQAATGHRNRRLTMDRIMAFGRNADIAVIQLQVLAVHTSNINAPNVHRTVIDRQHSVSTCSVNGSALGGRAISGLNDHIGIIDGNIASSLSSKHIGNCALPSAGPVIAVRSGGQQIITAIDGNIAVAIGPDITGAVALVVGDLSGDVGAQIDIVAALSLEESLVQNSGQLRIANTGNGHITKLIGCLICIGFVNEVTAGLDYAVSHNHDIQRGLFRVAVKFNKISGSLKGLGGGLRVDHNILQIQGGDIVLVIGKPNDPALFLGFCLGTGSTHAGYIGVALGGSGGQTGFHTVRGRFHRPVPDKQFLSLHLCCLGVSVGHCHSRQQTNDQTQGQHKA